VTTLQATLDRVAEDSDFSGVAEVDEAGTVVASVVRGHADRAQGRPITRDTRFGAASFSKGVTALVTASLVDSGLVDWHTPVRELLADELPLVDRRVTVEHLVAHTSGVGDYLDEEVMGDVEDVELDIPVHHLASPRDFLPLVAGVPQRAAPGTEHAYNNGAYTILSIAVEAVSGRDFYDLVDERVLGPAGMTDSGFFRSDALPPRAALGYLADGRTNVFVLPVRGAGDGGMYTTVDDANALWRALFAGRIVSPATVERMTTPSHPAPVDDHPYGLGFMLTTGSRVVALEGMDAGASARSGHDPESGRTYTVLSNTTDGAWPLVRELDRYLGRTA
jgi:CubicO group peptidase (beta-lactamase class C family)